MELNDRLQKKEEREKREYERAKEKLFLMNLGKNKDDFDKYLKRKRQKGANYGTLTNRVYDLVKFIQWFPKKRILDLNEDDILDFFCDLDDDDIKYISRRTKKGESSEIEKVYTYETKLTIKKSLKTYFMTMLGEYNFIKHYANLKGSSTNLKITEKPYLTYEQVKQVLDGILRTEKNIDRKLRDLFMVSFLFEMGCRGCELQAMKIKDIYYSGKEQKWVAYIPAVKTTDRTVAIQIFDTYITRYIDFLKKEKKLNVEDKIIELTSKTIRTTLNKRCVEFLGNEAKFVTTHTFRHSSAFFFTTEKNNLNYQDFVKRFGWSIKSKEATRYFDKDRIISSEIVGALSEHDAHKHKVEVEELKEKEKKHDYELNQIKFQLNILQNQLQEKISKEIDNEDKNPIEFELDGFNRFDYQDGHIDFETYENNLYISIYGKSRYKEILEFDKKLYKECQPLMKIQSDRLMNCSTIGEHYEEVSQQVALLEYVNQIQSDISEDNFKEHDVSSMIDSYEDYLVILDYSNKRQKLIDKINREFNKNFQKKAQKIIERKIALYENKQ